MESSKTSRSLPSMSIISTENGPRSRSNWRSDLAGSQNNLGVLLSKEQPKEALVWCRRAAELVPENPQYGYTYAFYLYQAGQVEEALRAIRGVRQRHPEHEDSQQLERQLLQEQEGKRGGGKN